MQHVMSSNAARYDCKHNTPSLKLSHVKLAEDLRQKVCKKRVNLIVFAKWSCLFSIFVKKSGLVTFSVSVDSVLNHFLLKNEGKCALNAFKPF